MLDWNTKAALALGVALLQIVVMATTNLGADLVIWAGVTVLLLTGVLTPDDALSGLSNEGMVTVGVLFVVVAGLSQTGGISHLVGALLGRPRSAAAAQLRVMVPVAAVSSIMNNTPLVATLIGPLNDWCKSVRISPSRVMLPLSVAAILGGTCSLIGTSTNLVVHGLMQKEGLPLFSLFDLAWVGVPATIVGIAFVVLASPWLMPDRRPAISLLADPRQYTVEMIVQPGSPLVGKSIEAAGLRHLIGMFLVEIDRDGTVLAAVGPAEVLRADDRLIFAGIVESVVELQKFRGLVPATNQVFKLAAPRADRSLFEAVVSRSNPVVGQTIREGRFRNRYNAVVIAAARSGERIRKKIGDIELSPGDTLLLEAPASFAEANRNNRDFLLVSQLENSTPLRHERSAIATAVLVLMVGLAATGTMPMLQAAALAAMLMMLLRCCSPRVARATIDWPVLMAIAGSFAIGRAIQVSGAADLIAVQINRLGGGQPMLSLAVVYLGTLILTELITNNAAAALMFPIAVSTAEGLGLDFKPFAIALMMAASSGFATPMGYQTHLMVYGPGGYKFSDFVRMGVPLDILIAIVTLAIAPLIWPLQPA